jgi:hypothetical protein
LFGTGLITAIAALGLAFVPDLNIDRFAIGVLAVFALTYS